VSLKAGPICEIEKALPSEPDTDTGRQLLVEEHDLPGPHSKQKSDPLSSPGEYSSKTTKFLVGPDVGLNFQAESSVYGFSR
jgi:hypothetical protein